MRQSTYLLPTLREAPAEAETISHRLMLRAGFIRQLAAGIYTYLPLGWRVLRKVESIVREEMDRAGAQEILMPAMQPAELWQESGRYQVYGPELIRLHDRHEREFALGPTHEEVVTTLVRNEIRSYRKLPINLYQIQTKFRDERRPRFGLLRGREFLMKDAYSFDLDWEGLDKSYWAMYDAYTRIFTRCGLNFRAVEADAGAIGGEGGTHEFMALADIGEDTIATCTQCEYAANLEKAEAGPGVSEYREVAVGEHEKFHTPNIRTIEQLTESLGVSADRFIKTLIYLADGQPVAVLVRGDHDANEVKVKNYLGATNVELADPETTRQVTGAPVGFAGPVGLKIPVLVDREVASMQAGIAGANEQDYHLRNVRPGRDFPVEKTGDFRNVLEGDRCPRCSGTLKFYRGIEVGHVFKLGTKYSEKLGAKYLDANGKEQVMIMGCYGIGVSRVLSAIVEQSHDDNGMIWPVAVAPFHVHLIPVSVKDEAQIKVAEELYDRLRQTGVEVLMDDRDERPGVKFKDSDLTGIPIRLTVGKGAGEGRVEYKERAQSESMDLSIEEAMDRIVKLVKESK
ncbi:proline--tRNA ligase [Effusibacillus lacus]|uniref:Proline--tRNA ligase n=1 Tax=Effusibacillus lacus TaxID=1348429 RepID=A0A292YPZ9_9BACL|nr:proline--tRNA ligase [Effusibacillus lacus]TCS73157.1 prolyl-tRNA synthetase [Effusibacillus lacus]GAX90560.1 proline--tRNA ligase [Effusibacillus lacus]